MVPISLANHYGAYFLACLYGAYFLAYFYGAFFFGLETPDFQIRGSRLSQLNKYSSSNDTGLIIVPFTFVSGI